MPVECLFGLQKRDIDVKWVVLNDNLSTEYSTLAAGFSWLIKEVKKGVALAFLVGKF